MSDIEHPTDDLPDHLDFHYIKSNYFRVIHVDGVHGGLTPRGGIHMALFNDRMPIPRRTVSTVDETGSVGEEIHEERESKKGIVREVEVDVIMNLSTARSLHAWLGEKIEHLSALADTHEQAQMANDRDD